MAPRVSHVNVRGRWNFPASQRCARPTAALMPLMMAQRLFAAQRYAAELAAVLAAGCVKPRPHAAARLCGRATVRRPHCRVEVRAARRQDQAGRRRPVYRT